MCPIYYWRTGSPVLVGIRVTLAGRILLIVGSLKLWEYDVQTPRVLPEEFCAAAS